MNLKHWNHYENIILRSLHSGERSARFKLESSVGFEPEGDTMRTLSNRAIAAATAVALGLTAIAATPASASPRRYHHGNAAAIGAAVAIFGTIAAIAAANARD